MPLCALAVHQARYYLTYGRHSGAHLAREGHAYLSATELIVLFAAAPEQSRPRRLAPPSTVRRRRAAFAAALVACLIACRARLARRTQTSQRSNLTLAVSTAAPSRRLPDIHIRPLAAGLGALAL